MDGLLAMRLAMEFGEICSFVQDAGMSLRRVAVGQNPLQVVRLVGVSGRVMLQPIPIYLPKHLSNSARGNAERMSLAFAVYNYRATELKATVFGTGYLRLPVWLNPDPAEQHLPFCRQARIAKHLSTFCEMRGRKY